MYLGDSLTAQCVLLMLVVQDMGSFSQTCHGAIKVFKVAFWMRKHLAMTWKRTWIWGTSNRIASLDLGPLLKSEKPMTVKTTIRKKNKHGEVKWQGSKALKDTQYFGNDSIHFNYFYFVLYPTWDGQWESKTA